MGIFKIEGNRIDLREFQISDLDAIYNITLQPEIAEYLPDWIAGKEQRREWLIKYEIPENRAFVESIPKIGANILRMAIVLKETNEVIGWIVSGNKDEVPEPNREVGYGISNKFTGKGYATEAVKLLSSFIFENTDTEELIAIVLPRNLGSNRVIQKSGFKFINVIKVKGEDFNYYRLKK